MLPAVRELSDTLAPGFLVGKISCSDNTGSATPPTDTTDRERKKRPDEFINCFQEERIIRIQQWDIGNKMLLLSGRGFSLHFLIIINSFLELCMACTNYMSYNERNVAVRMQHWKHHFPFPPLFLLKGKVFIVLETL